VTQRAALFFLAIALTALLGACRGGGQSGDDVARGIPAATIPAAVATSGHGLLIPRDQRLFLRDMSSGKEYVLKRSEPSVFYTYPRWSPDGSRIAYALDTTYTGLPNQDWGSDIALASVDGSGEEIVFRRPSSGVRVDGMAWAPDGTSLYVSLLETTIKDGRFLGQTLNLERLNLSTGERRVIVPDASFPTVSPDGSRIAYVTFSSADDTGGLWVARSDGSDRRLILPMSGKFVVITQPRFSPDGSTIAFAAATFASGAEQPTPGGARPSSLSALPASAHGLPQDIWTIAADGGEPQRLTNMLEDEPSVAWSPDGRRLAVIATGGLYVIDAGGGEPRNIGPGGFLAQVDWR
jgi:Tol biopolymer transport system component